MVESLQVELLVGLDGNKPHVLPGNSFGNGLGIEEVILVRLKIRFYELCRDQAHFVSLAADGGCDKVRS